MNIETKITQKESLLIQNIINKVTIYMQKNNQTLFSLAQTTGFAYQPLHRLMKGTSVPSLASLSTLSDYLNCSISELINDEFFLDIDVITSIKNLPDYDVKDTSRIYVPFADYAPHMSKSFFLLQESDDSILNKVFYQIDEVIGDGEFIVNYRNKYQFFNVILSSSKFVIIEHLGKEEKIAVSDIKVFAKLFKYSVMFDHDKNQINNVII